jgi:hypothetical protein
MHNASGSQPNMDQFQVQAAYGVGAIGYVTNATNTSTIFKSGNRLAAGWATDGRLRRAGWGWQLR